MFFIYQILFSLIILLSPIIVLYRIIKRKEHTTRFAEKFSRFSGKRRKGKLIWFHGSSVGEILSIVPIVRYYEKKIGINNILITSSTLSSSKIIDKFKFKKVIHQFYPLDYFIFTKKFLNYWNPNIAIFIDSEIWPAMFREINLKKIPLILLNARITKRSYRKWMWFSKFSKEVFNKITKAYPQNKETQIYLKKLKTKNIKFLGNLKFIEDKQSKNLKNKDNFSNKFKKYKIWVAASTHKGEEIFCAKAHKELKKKNKKLITIIIPRHVDRAEEIKSEIQKLNLIVTMHTSKEKNLEKTDIYLVDVFGESKKFYELGPTVFLGKSLTIKGGQNPLEAVHHNSKIIHGPFTDNFKDVYKLLKSLKASYQIRNTQQLISLISFKKNNIIGKKIKKIGKTILNKTTKEIDKFIYNENKKT